MVGPPQIISRSTWRSPVGHGGPPPGQWGTREGDVAGWPIVLGPHLSCAHPPPARRTPSWRPTALRHQLYIPDTVRVRTCKTGEEKHAEKVKKLRDPHPRARRYLQIYFQARHAVTLGPPRCRGPTCHSQRSQKKPGGQARAALQVRRPETGVLMWALISGVRLWRLARISTAFSCAERICTAWHVQALQTMWSCTDHP